MKRQISIALISFILIFSIYPSALIANTLYFPHIASNAKWETEICLINTGMTKNVSGTLKAYNDSGKLLSSVLITLGPGFRQEIIIGTSFVSPDQIGYILFESDSKMISGYLKFYIESKFRVAIPATSDVNTGDIFIPHIASNTKWWTGLSLLNTTATPKQLLFEFSDGSTKTRSIAAGEHQKFAIKQLFGNVFQSNIKSAVIKNGKGIVGLELFGSNDGTGENYLSGILLKGETAMFIYYPHIADYSKWWTGVVAYNPSNQSCDLTITPYQKDGKALASQTMKLPGKQKYIGRAKGLNFPKGSAWFRIKGTQYITGFELFGKLDGSQLGGYTGVGISGSDGLFPKIEKNGWTGIAFVNIKNESSTLTISAHDNKGKTIASEVLSLSAHEKVVSQVESLFSSNIDAATYVRYSATNDIVGFQLNGSDDGMMLDALPGDTFETSIAELLISKIIDDQGGTLSVEDFSLTIPKGIFISPADLSLYKMTGSNEFETDMITDTFRVSGIPDEFPDNLVPDLKYAGGLSDESFIVVGEEVFIPSQSATGMAYHLFPATPDASFLTYSGEIPVPDFRMFNGDVPPVSAGAATTARFLDFSGITGWKTYITQSGNGHFSIQYPVSSVTPAEVTSLGQYLETAYNTYDKMGFSYAGRTGWPVKVTVKKLGDQEYGLHCPSMWGHNSATLQFNRDKLNETDQVATTAGHELFHLVQYLYDPRNVLSRAKSLPPHHWLNEACAVWAEEKFSADTGYVSDIRAGHETNPFNGMHAGALAGDAGHHGYGMSAFIKFLENEYGDSIIRDIYLKIFDTVHPVEAINMATNYNLPILWEKFLRQYAAGGIYSVERTMITSINSGLFQIASEADAAKSFTENYPDLSARIFVIRLDDPEISPSKSIHFKIDQDLCDITLFKYRNADPKIKYLDHSTTKNLIQKDLRLLADGKYHLVVMVTNSNFLEPYTNSKQIKLDILVESMAAAMSISANPATLPADGVSTSAVSVTVTDDTGTPVEDEAVAFTSDSGSFESASVKTDSKGIAIVNYIAPNSAPPGGITTITATTTNSVTATASVTITATPPWSGWPAPQWCPQTSNEYAGNTFAIYPPNNPAQGIQCTYHGNAQLEWEIPNLSGKKDGWRKDYYESGVLEYSVLYVAGKREGTATWFFESGNIQSQTPYKNDLIEGNYVGYYENGQIQSIIPHVADLRSGMSHWFYDTGERMYYDPWLNGLRHGTKKAYYRSGPLKYEHPYKDGKKNGMTKGYYENTNLKYKTPYVNDKIHGTSLEYFETGELKSEKIYVDGLLHGLEKTYYTDGKVSGETPWLNGVKHGQVKYFDSNGDLSSCSIYNNGVWTGSCMPF